MRNRFVLLDIKDTQVDLPLVIEEKWVVIGTQILGATLLGNGVIEHAAKSPAVHVAGLEEPTQGETFLDGRSQLGVPPHQRNVALVFQNHALFPHLSVAENIIFGLKVRKVDLVNDTTSVEVRYRLSESGDVDQSTLTGSGVR